MNLASDNSFGLPNGATAKSSRPLPWGPFVLPLLFVIPQAWIYWDIAINLPKTYLEWSALSLAECVVLIIACFVGLIGMVFHKEWGLVMITLLFGAHLTTSSWDMYVMLASPPCFEVNHPLLIFVGALMISYALGGFVCCLFGLWLCRRIRRFTYPAGMRNNHANET